MSSELKGLLVHRTDRLHTKEEEMLLNNCSAQMRGMGIALTTPYDHLTVGELHGMHPTEVFRKLVIALMDMNFLFIIHSAEPDPVLEFLRHAAIAAGIERIPAEKYLQLPSTTEA